MVSTLIISPENGQSVSKAAGFNVVFESIGLMSGNGLNLANQFMKQPQSLNQRTGMIEGMQSISIQSLENELLAPEASVLSFFRILNTPSDPTGRTRFTIAINPGQIKTVGVHRMCTLAMSSSGIPAIMPVAQRGAQDDCIRVFIDQ